MRINKQIAGRIAKWATGAALLGAAALALPQRAEAQVRFNIGIGAYPAPVYAPAYPYGYDRWQRERWIEHQRWEAARTAELRREQWERDHWRGRAWDGRRW